MSTNTLKIFALICMAIDHIGEFFPQAPMWFRWIGRVSAPVFFYCSAWGFYYTHNKKVYLFRLYLLGIVMSVGNIVICALGGNETLISNDIFTTIYLGCVVVYLIEAANTFKEKIKFLAGFAIQQIIAFGLCVIFAELLQIPKKVDIYMLYYGYGAIFGSAFFTEGSICFVLFFAVVYYLKGNKVWLSAFVLSFAVILEFLIRRTYYMRGAASYLIPFDTYQWLMIFAIPFFWIYNGQAGRKMKKFYYLFYPLHIWVLYALSQW